MYMENFNCNKKEVRISRYRTALGMELGADRAYPLEEKFLD
jgi:hypothetical protein